MWASNGDLFRWLWSYSCQRKNWSRVFTIPLFIVTCLNLLGLQRRVYKSSTKVSFTQSPVISSNPLLFWFTYLISSASFPLVLWALGRVYNQESMWPPGNVGSSLELCCPAPPGQGGLRSGTTWLNLLFIFKALFLFLKKQKNLLISCRFMLWTRAKDGVSVVQNVLVVSAFHSSQTTPRFTLTAQCCNLGCRSGHLAHLSLLYHLVFSISSCDILK